MNEFDELTVIDYQLYMLKSMKAPEPFLSQSLAELDCTADTMMERAEKVSKAVRPGVGFAVNLRKMLHPALVRREATDQGVKYYYRLPLWGSLLYCELIDEEHELLMSGGLIRDADNPGQPMLRPWQFLEEDMPKYFDQVKMTMNWAPYVTYVVMGQGFEKPLDLRFGWGLLQEIEEIDDAFDDIPDWRDG